MEEFSPQMDLIYRVGAASLILFVIAYIGNLLTFSNRFVNALVTAIIFGAINAGALYAIDAITIPETLQDAMNDRWLQTVLFAAGLVFVIDLFANILSFSNRFVSALVTTILFIVLYAVALYLTGGVPSVEIPT
ncbi:MAG: hypothetical protein AAFQ42_02240 [Pseudomonadota bacterium]